MEDLNAKVTKAVQIKMIHDMLNGNNNYHFDFENLNNNKKKDTDSPTSKGRSGSPKSDSPYRDKKSKKGKKTDSSTKKKPDHCVRESEESDQPPLEDGAPNLSSYQKVVDRVFNTHQDKMANKLTCLCTMNCAAMLVPKATEFQEGEDELRKRIQGGGCGSDKDTSTKKTTKSTPDDDDDESS